MITKIVRLAAAASFAAAMTLAPAKAETVTLSVASWAGPNHAISAVGLKNWSRMLEEKSGGSLRLEVTFPPVHPKVMYDRVRERVSDVAWGFNGYTPGRFTTYRIAELPGLRAGSEALSVAYWRTHEKYLAKAEEYPGVKLLALFAQPPSVVHSRKAIKTLDDMKGMKIRVGGGIQGEVATHLGMVGVQAPVPEAYQMLKEGVVDGTFFPTETALSFKLTEVTSNQLGFHEGLFGGAYFVVMNPDSFASLSPEHQKIIDETSGEVLAGLIGRAWDGAENAAIEQLRKAGTFAFAEPALAEAVMARLQPLEDEYVQAVEPEGIDGRAAVDFMKAEARKLATK